MIESPSRPRTSNRRLATFTILTVVLLAYPLCKRGLILSDEGYLLMQAWDMLHGDVLYRDLDAFVTPGVWFLLAGLFSIVDPTVYATRLLALAGFAGIVLTVYRCVARSASRTYAIASSCALLIAVVWAFPSWTFSFYSPYSILFGLLGFERLSAWNDSDRRRDLFVAGMCFGLSILFKQNYGVFAVLGGLAAYLSFSLGRRDRALLSSLAPDAASVLVGGLIPAVPLLGYVLYQGVFDEAYHALIVQPFSDFAQHHTIRYLGPSDLLGETALQGPQRLTYGSFPFVNTPAMRMASKDALAFIKRLHVFLYLWPPLLFVTAATLTALSPRVSGRLDRKLLATLSFTGALFLGVFPRADSNHLMHVYQPVILLSAIVFHRIINATHAAAVRRAAIATAFALLICYAVPAGVWYKDLISGMDTRVMGRGGGVLVDVFTGSMLNHELELLEETTEPGEPVLTGPGLAMLNFLADRPVPSRYYNLYAVHIGHDQGREVVAASKQAGVRTAVIEYNNFYSDPEGLRDFAPVLTDYLREDFDIAFSVGQNQHAFLRHRSDRDAAALQRRDLLANCTSTERFVDGRMIYEHTMFRSLYLRSPINPAVGSENHVECTVAVPEAAQLRFMLDYTRPARSDDGAVLHADISVLAPDVHGEDGATVIFEHTIQPKPAEGWTLTAPQRMVVDLAPYANQTITLQLRTWATGRIKLSPFIVAGLTTIWMDPVVVWNGSDSIQ